MAATSTRALTLALDAMGGDGAPDIVIEGAALALAKYPELSFIFYGDEKQLLPLLTKHADLKANASIMHTEDSIAADEKPSVALRKGKNSSMRLAIDAVKAGHADGVVSAGNTGALMTISTVVLRTLTGISRPAIATLLPNCRRDILMLDLGANLECTAKNLVDFSVMGDAFARSVLDYEAPTVGLLNIGSEEQKGHEEIRVAAQALRENDLIHFHGYVEGDDILLGGADVVVTDGFSGNVALKTIEGTSRFITNEIKESFSHSWLAKLGFLLASGALKRFKEKVDPRRYNGAMFLGLNGIVVKSHGGTDGYGFSCAIGEAVQLVQNDINTLIVEEIKAVESGQSFDEVQQASQKEKLS